MDVHVDVGLGVGVGGRVLSDVDAVPRCSRGHSLVGISGVGATGLMYERLVVKFGLGGPHEYVVVPVHFAVHIEGMEHRVTVGIRRRNGAGHIPVHREGGPYL